MFAMIECGRSYASLVVPTYAGAIPVIGASLGSVVEDV